MSSLASSNVGDGSSILSEKVARALEVRTDTPAMKAALDALGHLESMDSRSVRVAIEQNALEQALLLQDELKNLVDFVSKLREGVTESAQVAHRVSEAIHTSVVSSQVALPRSAEVSSTISSSDAVAEMPDSLPLSGSDALEKEQQLAALLSDAFIARKTSQQRAETVSAFLEKFNLSEEDSKLLDQYNFEDVSLGSAGREEVSPEGMGMRFLDALERVKTIRSELSTAFGSTSVSEMLGGKEDNRLGASSAIRMMESLAMQQERAYERLYHWLQKYLHLNSVTHVPTSSNNSAIPPPSASDLDADALDEALSDFFVRRSLKVLCNVPAFYSHTIEMIASSRRAEETRRFLMALTAGYNGRSPIELKAHDPVNYVGDMLAFCFQSCSVEADVARGLVVVDDDPSQTGKDESKTEPVDNADLEAAMSASDMLSHAMGGLARPLKSRILQVVASLARRPDEEDEDGVGAVDEEDEEAIAQSRASSLYAICGLLLFYRSALKKSIDKLDKTTATFSESMDESLASMSRKATDNPLLVSIDQCLAEACQAYVASIKVYGAMLESLSLIGGTSEATLAQGMMERITKIRTTSPGFAMDVPCPNEEWNKGLSLELFAETLLDAAIVLCKTLDDSVILKLCLTNAKRAGLSTSVASELDARISQVEQTLIVDLVSTETKEVMEICGLGPVMTALRNMPPVEGMVMSTQPGLTTEDLDSAMKEFYASLYSPPIPSFEDTVKDPVLRKLARQTIANSVIDQYEELYIAVKSDKGGYSDLGFLGHTPEQVKTLFSA